MHVAAYYVMLFSSLSRGWRGVIVAYHRIYAVSVVFHPVDVGLDLLQALSQGAHTAANLDVLEKLRDL